MHEDRQGKPILLLVHDDGRVMVWDFDFDAWTDPAYGPCPVCGSPMRNTRQGYRWVGECVRSFHHAGVG